MYFKNYLIFLKNIYIIIILDFLIKKKIIKNIFINILVGTWKKSRDEKKGVR